MPVEYCIAAKRLVAHACDAVICFISVTEAVGHDQIDEIAAGDTLGVISTFSFATGLQFKIKGSFIFLLNWHHKNEGARLGIAIISRSMKT